MTCKFGHQMTPLALFAKMGAELRKLHYHIALDCPIGIISKYAQLRKCR